MYAFKGFNNERTESFLKLSAHINTHFLFIGPYIECGTALDAALHSLMVSVADINFTESR